MDELSSGMPRLLKRILPAEFVCRVVEPAYNDLLASRIERGQPEVGLLATGQFVVECICTAFPVFRVRRSRILGAVLAMTVVALVIVRVRIAYGPEYSPHHHVPLSGERAR
jgi:hypothetical protein